MPGLSTAGEAAALTALVPNGRYISLHTADPGNTGANEVSGGAYARRTSSFTQSGGNPTTAANTAIVEFPVATGAWGTITHFGIWSAASGGTFYGSGELDVQKAIDVDDVARFLAGQLKVLMN